MKRSLIVITFLAILAIPAIAAATPAHPGAYFSGFLGVSVPMDTDVTTADFFSPATFDDRVEFDPGINVGGSGGYDFGVIRLEGELSYKQSDIRSVTDQADGFRFGNVDGDLGAFAMMFNAFIDLHNNTMVTPYLGGGVGFAVLNLSDTFGTDVVDGVAERVLLYLDDDDTVFAYQAGVGLEIALNRQLSLDLGYRYFGTTRARFDTNLDVTTELRFESHNGVVGFRVKF